MSRRKLKKIMILALLIGAILIAIFICRQLGTQDPERLRACLIGTEIAYFLTEGGYLAIYYRDIKPTLDED